MASVLEKVITGSIRFSKLAVKYCESIKDLSSNSDRDSKAHATIVQEYMGCIFDNLTKQERALTDFAKGFNKLTANDDSYKALMPNIVELKYELSTVKIDMFVKFDLPAELTKKPVYKLLEVKEERKEDKEDKPSFENTGEEVQSNYRPR